MMSATTYSWGMNSSSQHQQFAFVNASDIVVGGAYHYQGRTVTVTEVAIQPGLHGFAEITYMAPTGGQRVNKTPKNRETYFGIAL